MQTAHMQAAHKLMHRFEYEWFPWHMSGLYMSGLNMVGLHECPIIMLWVRAVYIWAARFEYEWFPRTCTAYERYILYERFKYEWFPWHVSGSHVSGSNMSGFHGISAYERFILYERFEYEWFHADHEDLTVTAAGTSNMSSLHMNMSSLHMIMTCRPPIMFKPLICHGNHSYWNRS